MRVQLNVLHALNAICMLAIVLGAGLWSSVAHASDGGGGGSSAPSIASAIYVRTDSDTTTVVTPQVHFRSGIGPGAKTGVDVVYTADMWTSASVDVRSAASREVSEQRDEITVGIDHTKGLATFGAGYRFSHEVDYVSNGLSLSGKYEAFSRLTTFELRLTGARDWVGRSGDATFEEWITTTGIWGGITQVLTKKLLAQISYEARWSKGYQSSPYRFVAIGGDPGSCGQAAGTCISEVHPGVKLKNAAVLRLRQALTKNFSLGAGYRYYWDQWKIRSHTAMADVSYSHPKGVSVRAEYRGYTQQGAFFYRKSYASLADSRYFTRDRELSDMSSIRGSLALEYAPKFRVGPLSWTSGILGALTRYKYAEFVGLDKVVAREIALTLGVGF
jgi:hypothetical protein